MCDSGENETVEHVMLECVKYARNRSCRSKGPAQEQSRVACSIKIKIKISKVIVNRSEDESNAVWRIGEKEMNQAREYKYLGMWVSPSGYKKTE
ncbi:hypothetical protein E2C01_091760 [Portunus trituberculatus]|uniref:Uncharacterized protein n=1 Tax=Portunus trituberculatus TaxID=210409 RepID=A0A5B7JTT5_PORTR|nr:hypothetical protein [Portunus trituberculatus]